MLKIRRGGVLFFYHTGNFIPYMANPQGMRSARKGNER